MRGRLISRIMSLIAMAVVALFASGCATSRTAGVNTAIRHINAIDKITEHRRIVKLSDFDGVALLTLAKVGAIGLGLESASASVYVRNPETKKFGPPAFVGYGGPSIGLLYAGLNLVDCVVLFKSREAAERFAKSGFVLNFSNEASLLIWGRKQMTISGARIKASDGAGLSLGAIELEFLFGGSRNRLHRNMYQADATVDKILVGDVTVPPELAKALEKLNIAMER
jgi:lipid-binding SYLF domain-containing protein